MSPENVEIVQRRCEAFDRGDFETSLADLDPDIDYDLRHFPDGRVYHGHDGVREAFRRWLGTWEDYRQQRDEFIDAGDEVVVAVREHSRGKGSGPEAGAPHLWSATLRCKLDHAPLARDLDWPLPAELSPAPDGVRAERLEAGIIVAGVVVEQEQVPRPAASGERQRVRKARMPPTAVSSILRLGVLAVVDQKRRLAREAVSRDPRGLAPRQVLAEAGLVIRQVAEARAILAQPVAERGPAVGDEGGLDFDVADAPGRLRRVRKRNAGGKLSDLDRRKRL